MQIEWIKLWNPLFGFKSSLIVIRIVLMIIRKKNYKMMMFEMKISKISVEKMQISSPPFTPLLFVIISNQIEYNRFEISLTFEWKKNVFKNLFSIITSMSFSLDGMEWKFIKSLQLNWTHIIQWPHCVIVKLFCVFHSKIQCFWKGSREIHLNNYYKNANQTF